jgi:2-polyprenyl-3-methyl-5-hydroxy-6-metoxy-1,4-benzoquinol methylase
MPSSYPENIAPIIQLVAKCQPKSVLDIGVGRGKYGFLLREYFPPAVQGDWKPIDRIDGMDVFGPYLTPIHTHIYDTIFNVNVFDVDWETMPRYDLTLIIDVLEHWEMEAAYKLLDTLLEQGDKVLISTPTNIGCQGAVHGNEWERHITQWLPKHFIDRFTIFEDWSNDSSFIYVLGKL